MNLKHLWIQHKIRRKSPEGKTLTQLRRLINTQGNWPLVNTTPGLVEHNDIINRCSNQSSSYYAFRHSSPDWVRVGFAVFTPPTRHPNTISGELVINALGGQVAAGMELCFLSKKVSRHSGTARRCRASCEKTRLRKYLLLPNSDARIAGARTWDLTSVCLRVMAAQCITGHVLSGLRRDNET